MNDYMTALLDRFGIKSPGKEELAEQVKAAEDTLKEQLGKDQRRLLLRLMDAQNTLCEEATLYGFLSGFRLASGILRELDTLPRFSIADEDDARARGLLESERGERHE